MLNNNIRLAWTSIKSAKLRSLLTMLGVIIGVVSVITTVSLGAGIRRQVSEQINAFGDDLLIIQSKNVNQKSSGLGLFSSRAPAILTQQDFNAVSGTRGVKHSSPIALVNGVVNYGDNSFNDISVVGVDSSFIEILSHELKYGSFITEQEEGKHFAVIGKNVTETVFGENVPIGKSVEFRGKLLVVKAVYDSFDSSNLLPGLDLNNSIFVPYTTAQTLSNNNQQILYILAKPESPDQLQQTKANITQSLKTSRGGQEDFVVLEPHEAVELTNNLVVGITAFVTAIAAISLIVGGVGIMNVMLASVTERTPEIGIRKAVGATNAQIMQQFMIESIMISTVGSTVGVGVSLTVNIFFRLFTDIKPVIYWQLVVFSFVAAIVAGVIFGAVPALKAARKDPIDALRH